LGKDEKKMGSATVTTKYM